MASKNTEKPYDIVKVPLDKDYQRKLNEKHRIEPIEIRRLSSVEVDAAKQEIDKNLENNKNYYNTDGSSAKNVKTDNSNSQQTRQSTYQSHQSNTISKLLTPILIKALISGAGAHWILSRPSTQNINFSSYVVGFLIFYLLCSIYQFSLLLTKNYFLAVILTVVIPFIAISLGLDELMGKIFSGQIGQELSIALYLLFPIGLDVFRIIRLTKNSITRNDLYLPVLSINWSI
jgi:hypothetical protein